MLKRKINKASKDIVKDNKKVVIEVNRDNNTKEIITKKETTKKETTKKESANTSKKATSKKEKKDKMSDAQLKVYNQKGHTNIDLKGTNYIANCYKEMLSEVEKLEIREIMINEGKKELEAIRMYFDNVISNISIDNAIEVPNVKFEGKQVYKLTKTQYVAMCYKSHLITVFRGNNKLKDIKGDKIVTFQKYDNITNSQYREFVEVGTYTSSAHGELKQSKKIEDILNPFGIDTPQKRSEMNCNNEVIVDLLSFYDGTGNITDAIIYKETLNAKYFTIDNIEKQKGRLIGQLKFRTANAIKLGHFEGLKGTTRITQYLNSTDFDLFEQIDSMNQCKDMNDNNIDIDYFEVFDILDSKYYFSKKLSVKQLDIFKMLCNGYKSRELRKFGYSSATIANVTKKVNHIYQKRHNPKNYIGEYTFTVFSKKQKISSDTFNSIGLMLEGQKGKYVVTIQDNKFKKVISRRLEILKWQWEKGQELEQIAYTNTSTIEDLIQYNVLRYTLQSRKNRLIESVRSLMLQAECLQNSKTGDITKKQCNLYMCNKKIAIAKKMLMRTIEMLEG